MLIKTHDLSKSYNGKKVVKDLNIEIRPHQILGLLGPNGAGKSTSIKMLSGQIKPTSGEIEIDGNRYSEVPKDVLKHVGVMPQEIILWEELTIKENLNIAATIQGMKRKEVAKANEVFIQGLNLEKELDTQARHLSGGYRRRLNLAVSIIHEPDVIFLDEPTPGIDAHSRRFLMDYIRTLPQKGKAVVLTDHYLDEAEKLSDYIVIIDNGEIIAKGTFNSLRASYADGFTIICHFEGEDEAKQNFYNQLLTIHEHLNIVENEVSFSSHNFSNDFGMIETLSKEYGINVLDVTMKQPSLEDIFLHLTGRGLRE